MTKAAIIISAILVFAGVAAASSLPGLGSGSDTPTIDTPTLGTTTNATTTGETTTGTTTTNRTTTTGAVHISGPCDEAEHANDPRCTGAAPQARDDRGRDDDGDRHGRNRGPGGGDDDRGDDDNSGPGVGNSGHGGGDDDD
jgi:hypothetical protein